MQSKFRFLLWVFSCFLFVQVLYITPPKVGAQENSAAPSSGLSQADKNILTSIMLLDYIYRDYPEAVNDKGEVINEFEYEEMHSLIKSVQELIVANPDLKNTASVLEGTTKIKQLIVAKSQVEPIQALINQVKKEIVTITKIAFHPARFPNLKKAAALYQQNCLACHGEKGDGKGPISEGLEPPPADFLSDRMDGISPEQAFQVIQLGVPGTSMNAFTSLSMEEIWDLAFYSVYLRHKNKPFTEMADQMNDQQLKLLASHSDTMILGNLAAFGLSAASSKEEIAEKIAGLRRLERETGDETELTASAKLTALMELAHKNLDDSWQSVLAKDYTAAVQKLLNSYLEGIELVEARLKSTSTSIVPDIERAVATYSDALHKKLPEAEVQPHFLKVKQKYAEAQQILEQKSLTLGLGLTASFVILVREGLEALLIIFAFMAVLRALKAYRALKWMHAGWIVGLALGVMIWFFVEWANSKIPPAARESLEGYIGILTIVVLVWVGLWMHTKTDAKKWKEFIMSNVQRALNRKNLWLIAGFSFLAVFREALETNLFLNLLWIDADASTKTGIMSGVLLGFLALAVLGVILYLGIRKMPVFRVFRVTTILIFAIAVIILGKSIHSFQELGYVTVSSLPFDLYIEALGVYPTWETILSQIIFALVIGLLLMNPFKRTLA